MISSFLRMFISFGNNFGKMRNRGLIMVKKGLSFTLFIFLFVSFAKAQTAEVTISLNEQFFDALLDAIFKNANPPEFPLALRQEEEKRRRGEEEILSLDDGRFQISQIYYSENRKPKTKDQNPACNESIRLQREVDGVLTAVRFRDGKIYAPIAFSGNYNPPLIGCVGFSGWAETNVELEFDRQKQTLVGRAKVLNVNLSGTGGVGSSLITRLVQSSIDKKINPIPILQMDRVSFTVPIQNSGALRMKAVGMRHEIADGALNVRIAYEFQKGD
jgi:hypothetical protein